MGNQRNRLQRALRGAAPVLLCALSACATIQLPQRANLAAADTSVRGCARWFESVDAEVAAAGVIDLGARRIAGFPYLRSDRFSAALGGSALQNAQNFDAWVARLRDLDDDGRRVELANLPTQRIARLGVADRAAALARSQDCAARLAAIDLSEQGARALLVKRAQVEDDYSRSRRLLGLYAIAQWPFFRGIRAWQRETTLAFEAARAGELPVHPVIRYVPPDDDGYSRAEVSTLLEKAAARPFGVADFDADERDRLFATYAPQFEIETSDDYDRIGALFWGASASPEVDLSRPTVYRKLAYARIGDRSFLQLVYTVWMPARPKSHAFDLLGGRLDGIVWRVTLAPDGEPVLFDTIHPCGCFHMFFPGARLQPLPAPKARIEWAYSPAGAPTLQDKERMLLSAQTRTHYLRNISAIGPADGTRYAYADYDALRTLSLPGGGTRSVFGPDGLVPGTERGERFLFWPMGIDSAGAMRQWGTHATAFVGRRHFDDADLIERRFRLLR